MDRLRYIWIFLLFYSASCERDDTINNFPADVSFDVSDRLLEGRGITCIDFDDDGDPYIGSGTYLYHMDGSKLKDYNLGYSVLDLAVAPDQSVWIGTSGGGLCHFNEGQTEWYTTENAGLPRNIVMKVEAIPDGRIWFTSCAHMLGGLGVYDGKRFSFLTPENSPLNQNLITDIETDSNGAVYISTAGTVGMTNIYRIKDNSWKCLGTEEGTFYWTFNFSVSQGGVIFLVEDFSLSSTLRANRLFKYSDNDWGEVTLMDTQKLPYFCITGTDKRDYCWLTSSSEDELALNVYTGKKWISSPGGIITGGMVTVIKSDNDNNIWIGTYNDGIFILKQ